MEKQKVNATKWHQKVGLAAAACLGSVSAMAAAPAVTDVVADISDAKAPIAAVAGASLSVYVGLRVWKMVRRAI